MEKEVVLETPLFVFKEINELSVPQKCKVPQNIVNFPATSLVMLKSNENKYLCRLFYLNECFNKKSIAYVDNSVEIKGSVGEIKYVEKIELIERSEIVEFKKIKVKLLIDASNLNLNIIKTHDDLLKVTKSLLKHYYFTTNCSISSDKMGIKKIFIISTSSSNSYGKMSQDAELEIDETLVDTTYSMNKGYELGGMKNAIESLEKIVSSNLEYKKNPKSYPVRPPCQALIFGPIGCGKTSLVHHISKKLNCNLFDVPGDIFKAYPGETEQELERIFNRIRKISELVSSNVSIVLIENIELFCPKTDNKMKENSHSARIAALIYSFLDDISSNTKGILVIGTTSKIESVNVALRRFNRLGIEISLSEMPDENQRCEIAKLLINRMLKTQIEIQNIDDLSRYVAANTTGFVGADLELLCQFVLRSNGNKTSIKDLFDDGFQKINPSVMRDNLGHISRSTMTLNDIAGMDDVKKSLLTSILGPLKNPDKFNRFGLNSPAGILLYGPSGCAKTTIVKCLAGDSKMTLISVSSAEIYSPYVGEAEKFIVKLFNQARQSAPAILFFDEIDTIVGNRNKSSGSNDSHVRILSTLLTEIDGFGGRINKFKPILIVGATNRPECIDDALMRPGRFDKLIHIPAPDYNYRLQILKFLFQKMPIPAEVDVEMIAKRTELFSGADLANLCNESAMCAATRDLNSDTIEICDFENVLAFLRPSLSREKIEFYEQFKLRHASNF